MMKQMDIKCDEACGNCGYEIVMPYNKILECPFCGELILPCSACISSDGDDNRCNWTEKFGCYMYRKKDGIYV